MADEAVMGSAKLGGPASARDYTTSFPTAASGKFDMPGIEDSVGFVGKLSEGLAALRKEVATLSQSSASTQFFSKIQAEIKKTRDDLNKLNKEYAAFNKSGKPGTGSFTGNAGSLINWPALGRTMASRLTGEEDPSLRTVFYNTRGILKYGADAKPGGSMAYQSPTPGTPMPVAQKPESFTQQSFPGMGGGGGGTSNTSAITEGGKSAGLGKLGDSTVSDLFNNLSSGTSSNGFGATAEMIATLLTKPMQLAYNRVEENRNASLMMAEYLGPTANRTGVKSQNRIEELIGILSESIPMRGNLQDILGATDKASAMGFNFSNAGGRSGGFFGAARQFQMMNPATSAPDIVAGLGDFMGNAKATQRSVMLTGGAFSMQGAGGRTKTLQEWAESILKFFEGQRPGKDRGRPFSKIELETQHFPGSNMDAWFQTTGVPPYMQDAFWQYAITRAAYNGGTGDKVDFDTMFGAPVKNSNLGVNDLAMERLRGASNQARRDFTLASSGSVLTGGSGGKGTMYQHYATRERTDAGFQNFLSQSLDSMLGEFAAPLGGIMDKLPTPIADMLYKLMTSTGPKAVGAITNAVTGLFGDPGYGPLGSGMSHLTPSMQDRVGAMMKDNPRLQIVSGHRDGTTQHRLQGKGFTAPVGHSKHSQGVAADLGPNSEHAWIAANASKYGLDNAAHHGEPWHVGMPGTVPASGDPKADQKKKEQLQKQQQQAQAQAQQAQAQAQAQAAQESAGNEPWKMTGLLAGLMPDGAQEVVEWGVNQAQSVYNTVQSAAGWASALGKAMTGDFSDLMGKINLGSITSNIGQSLFNMLNGQFGGMLSGLDPFNGDYGEGGSGVLKTSGGSRAQSYWQKGDGQGGGIGGNLGGGGSSGGVGNFSGGGGVAVNPSSFGGGNVGDIKRLALQKMTAKGWEQYWPMLEKLVASESSWNPNAQNPTSTAYGLFQFLNSTWGNYGFTKTSDPGGQIDAGLKYIEQRYKTPKGAWDFWQSHHWYKRGGLVNQEQSGTVGEGGRPEVIIPLTDPDRARQLMDDYVRPVTGHTSGNGGGATTIYMPINVQVSGRPSEGDLRPLASMLSGLVVDELDKKGVRAS